MPMAIAAEVARAVQPAITGTRPDAASATVCTARAYSDRISEAASPVLPQTISAGGAAVDLPLGQGGTRPSSQRVCRGMA